MDFPSFLSGDPARAIVAIREFVQQFSQKFPFPEIEKWPELWAETFIYLNRGDPNMTSDCLSTLRILSRDKTHMNSVLTEAQIRTLLELANLIAKQQPQQESTNSLQEDDLVVVESLKCLCNLVFNSITCQDLVEKLNAANGILKRIRCYREMLHKYEVQYFDMKLLFLVTALNTTTRARVRDELKGMAYLTDLMDAIVEDKSSELSVWFEDRDIDLVCEILKVLFNLTSTTHEDCDESDENELPELSRLVSVLRAILLRMKTTNREKRQELHSNVINLISGLPNSSLVKLTPPIETTSDGSLGQNQGSTVVAFEGHDVTCLQILLDFLQNRLECISTSSPVSITLSSSELVSSERIGPILTALIKCARSHRILRRYIRSIVLPPLTDVTQRPEVGSGLRNILCRLMTSPNTQIRDLVAELLFILCKENVARMAKYTGYGNSMGMFANKGLLGQNLVDPSQAYSSDSGESDTEEYRRAEHGINPVTGCFEPPRPNPFENMSDEQKEYEAMKLVNLIDQLDRKGIIKPARIAEDGKPKAVDHVLQLQDEKD